MYPEPEVVKERKLTFQEQLNILSPQERQQKQLKALIIVQKWVRGHQARVHARRQKDINFKQMRKLRRLLSVAHGKLRNKMVKSLIKVLRESGNLHADQSYQLWQKYKTHCALLVQKSWRGYRLRYLMID